ncbi:methylated-DNA--protein-cysteine methyltransferase isoform X2 [Phyllostomus hastatus]|nr:methylated-DNA--protein-cysteine methyltransferase isoform X2 [Phyllostomus hastatus]XP_045710253.1 methylated-DNA--protein-cysteine methyltransferase isoform X2 [Phyllostomus hastatus]XP_045710254.1 methylated-DNA--protein-cysteine methyltransferase isoform X2 [Phyllostomus hastatus]XP_045710255.1 methylated-DNA--protein-cysteine methyltransferase isoform X2 [Phyllostomus hastatus]
MDAACDLRRRTVASPLGPIEVSACERGLHSIRLLGGETPSASPTEAPAAPEPPGSPAATAEPLAQCEAWLHAYFQRPEALQELPVPALHHPIFLRDSFTRQVLCKLLKAVSFGEVVSYQQLAALAGSPRAARAVGGAMRSNPDLGIDEAASENKPVPRGPLPARTKAKLEKYSAGPGIRGNPPSIARPFRVVFVGDKSMGLEVLWPRRKGPCPHPGPVPPCDLQQRSPGQLLRGRGPGHEGVAPEP